MPPYNSTINHVTWQPRDSRPKGSQEKASPCEIQALLVPISTSSFSASLLQRLEMAKQQLRQSHLRPQPIEGSQEKWAAAKQRTSLIHVKVTIE